MAAVVRQPPSVDEMKIHHASLSVRQWGQTASPMPAKMINEMLNLSATYLKAVSMRRKPKKSQHQCILGGHLKERVAEGSFLVKVAQHCFLRMRLVE